MLVTITSLGAEETTPESAKAAQKAFVAGLKPRRGAVDLNSGLAQAVIPTGYNYLGPEDTEKVLVKLWGNPPAKNPMLGMIYPADEGLSG